MTDSDPTPQGGPTQGRPPITINAQYIKDLSFEVPGAPRIFAELDRPPEVQISVDVGAQPMAETAFEVVLHFRVESRLKDTVAFIAELKYGCLVSLNIPVEHHQPVLLIEVPRLMFPFARNILSDMTRDGGFPPLMMQPLDFAALYRNRQPVGPTPATGAGPATPA